MGLLGISGRTADIRDKVTNEMIISFSVENFRSFHAEATLSLVASSRLAGDHGNHAVAVSGTSAKILRTAVIYGANGAGKSNLFKSLDYLRSLALPVMAEIARVPDVRHFALVEDRMILRALIFSLSPTARSTAM